MKEQDLRKIFEKNKTEIPDDGFSERVFGQLPERGSLLPQIVMAVSIITGIVFIIITQDFTFLIEQFFGLIISIIHLKTPSTTSVVTYLGFLAMVGIIGFTALLADTEY